MDVTLFDKLYAPIQSRQLIHPYSDSSECRAEIRCVKLEELLAIKIKLLLQRRHSFDLFDLVYSIFVNDELDIDRNEIVTTFLRRTIFEPSPGVVKGLLLGLPLEAFRRFWDDHLVCPRSSLVAFDKGIEWFRQLVEDLFGQFPVTSYGAADYFSSEYRNAILEAGRNQTLLRITYDGITREVEPYALKYKKPQNRPAREYFYAYDLTGGRNGNTGIKAFVHANVEAIDNTDTKFDPRFEVEVAKAGEIGANSYFSRPFSRGTSASSRRSRSTSGVVYIVQCTYCLKKFRRSKYNTRLNKHKDGFGNQCYGRYGVLVDQTYLS